MCSFIVWALNASFHVSWSSSASSRIRFCLIETFNVISARFQLQKASRNFQFTVARSDPFVRSFEESGLDGSWMKHFLAQVVSFSSSSSSSLCFYETQKRSIIMLLANIYAFVAIKYFPVAQWAVTVFWWVKRCMSVIDNALKKIEIIHEFSSFHLIVLCTDETGSELISQF